MSIFGILPIDKVTIFTPTYNRAATLDRLFLSLQNQTVMAFEWVIVDDGSTDNTEAMVKLFQSKAAFPIIYVKKNNEGKHIAINEGAKIASYGWFFIVDSDDYLLPEAIKVVLNYCMQISACSEFAGVVGLRGNEDGAIIQTWYGETEIKKVISEDTEYIDANAIEYRNKYKFKGDRAEIIKTDILLKYPFPKFSRECFMGESVLWLKIANDGYKFRWFNKVIYITDYREDGLTQHINEIYKKNWRGTCYLSNECINYYKLPIKERFRCCVNYFRYGYYGNQIFLDLFNNCNDKFMAIPASIIAKARCLGK